MAGCCSPSRDARGARARSVSAGGSAPPFVTLTGGTFLMGSDDAYAYPTDLEGPVRAAFVGAFDISVATVTVAEFDAFARATGYVTDAESFGDSLVAAAALPVADASPAVTSTPWWRVVRGASWRRPSGPDSELDARRDVPDHPVTHVSRRDAWAFCAWSGTTLPTEEQWEFAARGGLEQQPFPWGAEEDLTRMNTWAGEFPGFRTDVVLTEPAVSHAPNDFGLYNCTGNVWEWTTGTFDAARRDPRGVIRGGSHMCHASYCRRYRTSARSGVGDDTSSGHIGFRVVRNS
ncbi:hypothetical protein GCM10007304_04830 [Rhodococcoides trifolii]|uniref:Sulfatase-modifying factor enzyme-like domain-containing protein n=1 Tax=Rhodococcoides trifolii TaxID=908250 RepID=A0A917FP33_9NOCA|nr:SUMF1/EgtB/PvdO family nonheme iron enzyme [Rhodococcus trifolii]GGF94045.1 hypothetical protein GCM10007304_04830 [Rhodococcus trifolii]